MTDPYSLGAGATSRARWLALPWLVVWLLVPCALASPPFEEPLREALQGAIEAAFALDLYHSRCRGDQSGRHSENLNKLLVGRYRITVLGAQDDYFPERDYRAARARMESEFQTQLRAWGGCPGAKAQGISEQLRQRLDAASETLRRGG